MPVTEVILDPGCVCRPYEPAMREQFLQMNPYHISCPYKPVFAENAVKQLLAYDDSLCGLLSLQFPEGSHSECVDSHTSTGNNQTDSQDGGVKIEDMANNLSKLINTEESQNQMTFMDGLRINRPAHCQKDLSPWATCKNCGYEEVSQSFVKHLNTQCKPRGRRVSAYQSSSAASTAVKNKPASRGGSASRRNTLSADSAKQEQKHRHNNEKTSALHKNQTDKPNINYKKKPIRYKFKHSMKPSDYMSNYREVYTRAAMCLRDDSHPDIPSSAGTMGASLSHDDINNMPNMQALCKDLRESLKPTSPGGINKSIKMSHFCFDIAKGTTLRTKIDRSLNTISSNKHSSPRSPTLGTVSPRASSSRRTFAKVGTPACPPPGTTLGLQQKPPSPCPTTNSNNPVVCRSRPSIPSNARGIICATAIETPSHLVSGVKAEIEPQGKSRWRGIRERTSPQPPKVYEKQRGGTQVYEKLNTFYNMSTSTSQASKRTSLMGKKMLQ